MYKQAMGSLIYLTMTKPEIIFAVGVASLFMHKPKKPHLKVICRIIRNVKGIANLGLLYKKRRRMQTHWLL